MHGDAGYEVQLPPHSLPHPRTVGVVLHRHTAAHRHTRTAGPAKSSNSPPAPETQTSALKWRFGARVPGVSAAARGQVAWHACAAPTQNFEPSVPATHPTDLSAVKCIRLPPFLCMRRWPCEALIRSGRRAKWAEASTCLPTLRPPCAHAAHIQPLALAVRSLLHDRLLCRKARAGALARAGGWSTRAIQRAPARNRHEHARSLGRCAAGRTHPIARACHAASTYECSARCPEAAQRVGCSCTCSEVALI